MGKQKSKTHKSYDETFNEIKDSAINAKTGKRVKSFSRSDYTKLTTSLINTPDYTAYVSKVKDGKVVIDEVKPVKEFREFLASSATKRLGVDESEAKNIMSTTKFEESELEWMYPLTSESIYGYISTGKKYDLLPKNDFKGGINLQDIAESVNEYTAPSTKQKGKIKKEAHKKLKVSGKIPPWLKTKLK